MLRLRAACDLGKRKLSQLQAACIEVPDILDGIDYSCTFSRAHFEELCREDIEAVLHPLDFCLQDNSLNRRDIHDVVLVGGSARVPKLRISVKEFFYGKVPREVLRPDHAASLGAAAYAAVLLGQRQGNVAPELSGVDLKQIEVTPQAPRLLLPLTLPTTL